MFLYCVVITNKTLSSMGILISFSIAHRVSIIHIHRNTTLTFNFIKT